VLESMTFWILNNPIKPIFKKGRLSASLFFYFT
jgi:hypothetical protein